MRVAISLLSLLLPLSVAAAPPTVELTIKDHRFEPTEVHVPTGQRVKLQVNNQDASPEEFESYELNREKVVAGNSQISVYIGPLEAGRYPFVGEFHADTARGVVIAE